MSKSFLLSVTLASIGGGHREPGGAMSTDCGVVRGHTKTFSPLVTAMRLFLQLLPVQLDQSDSARFKLQPINYLCLSYNFLQQSSGNTFPQAISRVVSKDKTHLQIVYHCLKTLPLYKSYNSEDKVLQQEHSLQQHERHLLPTAPPSCREALCKLFHLL